MSKSKLGAVLVVAVLLISNAFTVYQLLESKKEAGRLREELAASAAKRPIMEFNQLFVEKVLGAEGEVGFETRLELENKVRELGNAEILAQWNKFVNAHTESEAQAEVKGLLSRLAAKMGD